MGLRTTEFVLGLIAGILGFLAALVAIGLGGIAGGLGAATNSPEAVQSGGQVVMLGVGAIVFSIIGIVGSVVVKGKPKLGGGLMLVAGIGGLISISFFYVLSFVLFLIAGLMGVLKKE